MKKVTSILMLLLLCCAAFSQTQQVIAQEPEQIEISFDLNSHAVDSKYRSNNEKLTHLAERITDLQSNTQITISKIKINSYASPDGGRHYNELITERRTDAIYNYLTSKLSLPDSLIEKSHSGIDWNGLQSLVEESDMHYRDEVLEIIKFVPEETWSRIKASDRWLTLVDSRIKHLMEIGVGNPYRYMVANFFPQLRKGSVVTIYFKTNTPSLISEAKAIDMPNTFMPTALAPVTGSPKFATAPISTAAIAAATAAGAGAGAASSDKSSLKFALKSNLLYDILLSPNIELEIPIKDRWSINGEWICPWWVTRNNGYALQILSGQVEGRYWFGDRENMPQLTGWFAGLYAGGGLYDLQWDNNGYQGEFYIAAGLAGGYAHTINKKGNLRMEYSLGLGYLSTEYRYYEGMQNNDYLVWQHDGRYSWLGPTKAKVSLVWFIDWKRGGKR